MDANHFVSGEAYCKSSSLECLILILIFKIGKESAEIAHRHCPILRVCYRNSATIRAVHLELVPV